MPRIIALGLVLAFSISTANAQPAPPSDSRLSAIVTNKVLRIAFRANAKPFSYVNERQEPIGYTIDLCRLVVKSIAQQFGIQEISIEWVPVDIKSRFITVADNKADMECGSSTVTLSRMKEVDFSSFVFVESTSVMVSRASGVRSFDDLAGKRIAVIAGTTNEQAIDDQLRARGMSATVIRVMDGDGVPALEANQVDAYASDKLRLIGSRFSRPEALAILPDELSVEPYAIVLPRGDWALRLAVNTGLSQAIRSGAAGEVFKSWFSQIGLRPGALIGAAFVFGGLRD